MLKRKHNEEKLLPNYSDRESERASKDVKTEMPTNSEALTLENLMSSVEIIAVQPRKKIDLDSLNKAVKNLLSFIEALQDNSVLEGKSISIFNLFKNLVSYNRTVPIATTLYLNVNVELILKKIFLAAGLKEKANFFSSILSGNHKDKIEPRIHFLHASFLSLCSLEDIVKFIEEIKMANPLRTTKQKNSINNYLQQSASELIKFEKVKSNRIEKQGYFLEIRKRIEKCEVLRPELYDLIIAIEGKNSENAKKIISKITIPEYRIDSEIHDILFELTKELVIRKLTECFNMIFGRNLLTPFFKERKNKAYDLFEVALKNKATSVFGYLLSHSIIKKNVTDMLDNFYSSTSAYDFFVGAFKNKASMVFDFASLSLMEKIKVNLAGEIKKIEFMKLLSGICDDKMKMALLSKNIYDFFEKATIESISNTHVRDTLLKIYLGKMDANVVETRSNAIDAVAVPDEAFPITAGPKNTKPITSLIAPHTNFFGNSSCSDKAFDLMTTEEMLSEFSEKNP